MKPDIEYGQSGYAETVYYGGRIFQLAPRNRKADKPPEIEVRLRATQAVLHVSNSIPAAIEFIEHYAKAPK